jgi:hypothetical protein
MYDHQFPPLSDQVIDHLLRPTVRVRHPIASIDYLPVSGANYGRAFGSANIESQ